MATPVISPNLNDPTNPISQGKLKALWDAIRTSPVQGSDQDTVTPPPAPGTAPIAPPALQQKVQEASMGAGPVASPAGGALTPATPPAPPPTPGIGPDDAYTQAQLGVQPAGPVPVAPAVAPMTSPLPDVLTTPGVAPIVRDADSNINAMPASARVNSLQDQIDAAVHPSVLRQVARIAVPLAAIAGARAFGGSQGGAGAIGADAALTANEATRETQRKDLASQLTSAQVEREKEFDTAQRTVEAANAAAEANRTRDTIARTLAGSRTSVADIQASGRTAAATTAAGGRDTAAQIAADAARYRADHAQEASGYAADQHLKGAKYAADTAEARQSRSLAAASDRQRAGFTHTDDKPTAAEDQRADLSDAFKSYATELDGIAARRPELFGKLAGRLTTARQSLGSDDPDVRAIKRIKEQLGTVSLAAHSLRSANHIGVAADSLINMNDSADSVRKNIQDSMKGVDTFQTITRPTLKGRTAPAPAAGAPKPKDSLGIL